jgi:hypothetical protein
VLHHISAGTVLSVHLSPDLNADVNKLKHKCLTRVRRVVLTFGRNMSVPYQLPVILCLILHVYLSIALQSFCWTWAAFSVS